MGIDESDLIKRLRQKDRSALEQVVKLYTGHLFKACLGLGFSETEADDVTQSVWITFFDVVHRFEGRSSVRTYLFGILYNKASEHRKQANRAEPTETIEEIIDSHFDQGGNWLPSHSPVSPDRFMQSAQTMALISKCLELLPLNQKMAFMMKEVTEEDSEEICETLKITSTNLGVLLFRARNQLRECIDRKSRG